MAGVQIQHETGDGAHSSRRSGGRGAGSRQQHGSSQRAADAEARQVPAVGGQGQTHRRHEGRLPPDLRRGGTVGQRRQQRGGGVEDRQRGGAQRPLARLPLEQIGGLDQQRHDHGGSGPEAGPPVQPRGAERGAGAEDQNGGGGVAQPRLKIQKKKSAQSGAQQGAEPGPADACGGDDGQRPGAIQTVQRTAGQQKCGRSR